MKRVIWKDWSEKYSKEINRVKDKYMRIAREEVSNWLSESSEEDFALRGKALEFEDHYFRDMTLKAYSKELTKAEIQDNTGEWVTEEDGFDYYDFSLDSWIIRYGNLRENVNGRCEQPIKQIRIKPGLKDEDLILMHEMIHAFEFLLKDFSQEYLQYVTIQLYRKIRPKVRNVMSILTFDMHKYFKVHSPLFMLKSLDLDIELKKPLGTVYGYGRADIFK